MKWLQLGLVEDVPEGGVVGEHFDRSAGEVVPMNAK